MVEADATLEKAVRASQAHERDRKQRLRWSASTAASYALDVLLLGLFVLAGTVPASAFYAFTAGAAAICAAVFALYANRWNLHFRDQSVIWPQTVAGAALHLMVVALAPQVAFPALANLFTVFAFGLIWLSLRESVLIWSLTVAATGAVLWSAGDRAGTAAANAFEICLSWLTFSLVLGRCLVLSVYANDLRKRLADSRGKLAASLEQVQQLASHDELTRTLNRRALVSSLERERVRAERSGLPFSISMMDLDHFKAVNDTYGHGTGDAVLQEFAATVHATMRATDVFGRYGGEEFMIILVGTESPAALEAMERIRAAVAGHDWNAIAPGLAQTVSGGIAIFRKGESIEQLLHRADQALYQAKDGGRNRIAESKS
jgi:diguanylate cyclase (GGDEF)-like protein